MKTEIHRKVELAQKGDLPNVVAKLKSGYLILGEKQVSKGYCLLLPDPVVPHLNALSGAKRAEFLDDMARVGDALLKMTGAARINYEMLGNLEPALHAHILPRYDSEPADVRAKPIWFHDWDAAEEFDSKRHRPFIEELKKELGV